MASIRRLFRTEFLAGGARMPAIGLGTFGSDHVSAEAVAEAVKSAAAVGYRHFDCASVYGNERQVGVALQAILAGGVRREELWVTSKLWNDKHARRCDSVVPRSRWPICSSITWTCTWCTGRFRIIIRRGATCSTRNPEAKPYIHASFMKTWRKMEELVDLGLVRHIGTSNMTIPKLKLLLRDARIKPAVNEMELHPHFQQPELFQFVREHGIEPIGYLPAGFAGPAGAGPYAGGYRSADGSGDRDDRERARRASGGGLPEVGGAARADADPVLDKAAELSEQFARRGERPADR